MLSRLFILTILFVSSESAFSESKEMEQCVLDWHRTLVGTWEEFGHWMNRSTGGNYNTLSTTTELSEGVFQSKGRYLDPEESFTRRLDTSLVRTGRGPRIVEDEVVITIDHCSQLEGAWVLVEHYVGTARRGPYQGQKREYENRFFTTINHSHWTAGERSNGSTGSFEIWLSGMAKRID